MSKKKKQEARQKQIQARKAFKNSAAYLKSDDLKPDDKGHNSKYRTKQKVKEIKNDIKAP
jgi:hypothetical protein